MNHQKSIIIYLPNWLGDVLMTLPALDYLNQNGFKIILFGKKWVKKLFQAMPYEFIDDLLLSKKIYPEAKTTLLFPNSFSSAWRAKKTGLKLIGYRTDWRRFLLFKSLPKPKSNRSRNLHESEIFLNLAFYFINNLINKSKKSKLNLSSNLNNYLKLDPKIEVNIKNKTQNIIGSKSYFVICPFAVGKGENQDSKVWPYWAEWVNYLSKNYINYKIICCPGPGENLISMPKNIQNKIIVLPNLDLQEYGVILKNAQCVFANDSGPMHLASAVGAKLIGLFGVTDPNRTHPLNGNYLGELGRWATVDDLARHFDDLMIDSSHLNHSKPV